MTVALCRHGPGADAVLVVVQQISRLRPVVPVPEEDVGGTARGAIVTFRVPAFPDRKFSGVVARIAHALDTKTRTMAVELDVANRDGVALARHVSGCRVADPARQARAVRT